MTDRPRADGSRFTRPGAETESGPARPVRPRRWWTDRHIVVVAYALLATAVWTVWALGLLGGGVPGTARPRRRAGIPGQHRQLALPLDRPLPVRTRRPDDPAPITTGPPAGTPVEIECHLSPTTRSTSATSRGGCATAPSPTGDAHARAAQCSGGDPTGVTRSTAPMPCPPHPRQPVTGRGPRLTREAGEQAHWSS